MTWEILFVIGLLLFAVVSFIVEKLTTDLTAAIVFSAILLAGLLSDSSSLPNLNELLLLFSNPAPLTIAGMFIVSRALEKNGAVEMMTHPLNRLIHLGYRRLMLIVTLGVGLASAFMNNTPVVMIFLPVVLSLARRMSVPASQLLIPLSYASIFGGTCTLIGTSTNILMSGIIKEQGQPPIGMFELTSVGFPLLIIGTTYLIVFGKKVLPVRETLTSILSKEERKEYLTEAYVPGNSQLIGQSFNTSILLKNRGIRLLEIIRNGIAVAGDLPNLPLKARDRLILSCRPSGILEAHTLQGVTFSKEIGKALETLTADEGAIVEGVIGPNSILVGKTPREINFRQHYRMVLLALHRRGRNVRERMDTLPFEFGDTLLMMGTETAINNLRTGDDILLLDRPTLPVPGRRTKLPITLSVLAGIIGVASLNLIPIVAAVFLGVTVLFLAGCLKPKDGYAAIDWRLLILIYGMLSLGLALEKSQATQLLAENLVKLTSNPYIALAALYLTVAVLTEFLSNNATVVLIAPIALGIAQALGVDPRPFIIAACIASSASFVTPIGYQTNTYVYSVGGYRFTDFAKAGIPLGILYFVGSLLIIPCIWPF